MNNWIDCCRTDQPLRVGESLAKTLCKVEPQCFIGHVLARVEVANSQSWTPCHAVCYYILLLFGNWVHCPVIAVALPLGLGRVP